MNTSVSDTLAAGQPGPNDVAVGCATCWAAKYCALFSSEGPQPPPSCPLLPKPASRRLPRQRRLEQH